MAGLPMPGLRTFSFSAPGFKISIPKILGDKMAMLKVADWAMVGEKALGDNTAALPCAQYNG